VAEHVLNVMYGPAAFEQARASFVTKVVKVQINGPVSGL